MREIKHLINLTSHGYIEYSDYNGNLDKLGNLYDMIDEFEDLSMDSEIYICDYITEIADSHIPVYTNNIWEEAEEIQEWIEEVITENGGLIKNDLIRTFSYAIYRYNEDGLYENLDAMLFNKAVQYLDDKFTEASIMAQSKLLEMTDRDLKKILTDYDGNGKLSTLKNRLDELIQELGKEYK